MMADTIETQLASAQAACHDWSDIYQDERKAHAKTKADLAALRQERDELKVGYERAVYGLKVAAADFRRCAKGLHHAQAMASFADSAEQAISEASILAALAQETPK